MSMSVANQWAEACDSAGVAAPAQAIAPGDLAVLLRAAMSGEPKRSDTFAEVGGGRGEAMAVAAELFDFGQEALFLPEDMQDAAEKVFQTAKDLNPIFESCQIILGEVQDLAKGSRMLTYFDIIFADTRTTVWGAGSDGEAVALSAAAGQFCLEGSRIVTVGRQLVNEEGVWAFDLLQTQPLSCGSEGYVWEVTRSMKSTAPDRAIVPEGAHVKGNWVTLVGLQKAPDLNGAIAVILEVDEEAQVLTIMIDETCQVIKVRAKSAQPTQVIDP